MTHYHRAPGIDVIDVLFTVHVPQSRAQAFFKENRRAAYAAKSPDRRIHPTRNQPLGLFK